MASIASWANIVRMFGLREESGIMQRAAAFLIGILSLGAAADADDKRGLHWSGTPTEVTISGVSSGAAMAVQYAVAHSQTIAGVGSIAGPAWGCADGSLSQAVNRCMCGRETVQPTIGLARRLALSGRIDALASGTAADAPAILRVPQRG